MGRIRVEDNIEKWYSTKEEVFDSAMGEMAKDIKNLAKQKVPYKGGDLFKEIYDEIVGKMRYRVIANTNYAAYQERGMRKDGSRKVRKYTTPNTGRLYLQSSGETVGSQGINYLRQANAKMRL